MGLGASRHGSKRRLCDGRHIHRGSDHLTSRPNGDGGLPASGETILAERGVDAQPMFMSVSLMCILWLAALAMLVQQAGFTTSPGYSISDEPAGCAG
jgi:hypothetical protein